MQDILELPIEKAQWMHSGISFKHNAHSVARCGLIKKSILLDMPTYYAIEIEDIQLPINIPKPISEFPVFKDISFELPENFMSSHLTQILMKKDYDFEIFDIFPSKEINIKRNIGIRFKFNAEKTLTKEEINAKIEQIKQLILDELQIKSS